MSKHSDPTPGRTGPEAMRDVLIHALWMMDDKQVEEAYTLLGTMALNLLLNATKPGQPAVEDEPKSPRRLSPKLTADLLDRFQARLGEAGWTVERIAEVTGSRPARGIQRRHTREVSRVVADKIEEFLNKMEVANDDN